MAENNSNKKDRAFDMLVDNVDKLADTVYSINTRVSKIEGALKLLYILVGSGGLTGVIVLLREFGIF